MTDTLASFVLPGMTILGPIHDRTGVPLPAVVVDVRPFGDRLHIAYAYPSGYASFQNLRPWDRVPIPEGADPLPTGPRTVGAG